VLSEIAKNDKIWRKFALKICGNKMNADDLVQEMYMAFHKYNPKLKSNDLNIQKAYVYRTIFRLFIKDQKQIKETSLNGFVNIECENKVFEPTDEEYTILKRYEELDWKQKDLLEFSYDLSLRQIEKEYPMVNYAYAYRQIKEARIKILQNGKEEE